MEEILTVRGWYFIGSCSCRPKKYKYKNESYPDTIVRVIRKMNTFDITVGNRIVAKGTATTIEQALNEL